LAFPNLLVIYNHKKPGGVASVPGNNKLLASAFEIIFQGFASKNWLYIVFVNLKMLQLIHFFSFNSCFISCLIKILRNFRKIIKLRLFSTYMDRIGSEKDLRTYDPLGLHCWTRLDHVPFYFVFVD